MGTDRRDSLRNSEETTIKTSWFTYLLPALCCSVAFGSLPLQSSLPTAKEIVERYDEALGGHDAIMRHTSSTTRGTMEAHDGATVLKLPLVYYARAPFQRLEKVSLPNGAGDLLNGFDGEIAWSFDPRPGPTAGAQISYGDDRESTKRDADFYYPLTELSWFKSMETVGIENYEGHSCYRVHGINNWSKVNDHFYDVETHLLDGYEFESQMGLTHEIFSDYKEIDGVLVPTKQTVKAKAKDGTWNVVYLLTFNSITFNDVDPSVFALPPVVRALAEKQKAAAKP
jgi:hypothetical protein